MKLRQYVLSLLVIGIAILAVAVPVSADYNDLAQNGTVLLGEKGLNVTNAVGNATYLAWWDSTSSLSNPPDREIDLSGYILTNFNIDNDPLSPFYGTEGTGFWWRLSASGQTNPTEPAFKVVAPQTNLRVRNLDYGTDVTDSVALLGDIIDFELTSSTLHYIYLRGDASAFNCKVVVTSPGGVKYAKLWTISSPTTQKDLTGLAVNTSPWYWSSGNGAASYYNGGWETDKIDPVTSFPVYVPGEYTVTVECNENNLGFVSTERTITLEEEQPVLTINPSSLIRGDKFYTTIQGIPNNYYLIWIKDCIACPDGCCSDPMSGACCDQPPMMVDGQEEVYFGTAIIDQYEYDFGDTLIEWCGCLCTETLYGIMPHSPSDGKYYYALIRLDENGERTIEWQTTTCTSPTSYKIRTQRWIPQDIQVLDLARPYAEGCVDVQKGVVTLKTSVCGEVTDVSYLGESVKVYGNNSDSRTTYLFITGPCQSCAGEDMNVTQTVVNGIASTFTAVPVKLDGSWEFYWYTRNLQIDLGQYTIYATSMPNDAPSLEGVPCNECSDVNVSCAAWTKKPFTFLEPTITADINPKILKIVCCAPTSIIVDGVATGLRGEAIGQQYNTVPIGLWAFGENKIAGQKYVFDTAYVDCPTGEFSIDLADYIDTLALQPGTYTVVVQHPMYNHRLDIIPENQIYNQPQWYYWWPLFFQSYVKEVWYPDANRKFVVTATPVRWSKLFVIDGPDRLAGTAALNALLNGFNDPNIDDNIVVLTFKVESNTALQADFSGNITSGAAPLHVKFTDISIGTPTSWAWNFGDGFTSTDQNPTHIYENPGTYSVTLTVTGASGSSSTTKNGYISVSAGPTPTGTVTTSPTIPPANTLTLNTGWNFISVPRTLADGSNTAGVVFAGVDTGGRSIYLYDAGTTSWQAMTASSLVKPLDGIWIYSTATKQITLTYRTDPLGTPPTKQLYAGWNAIGFSDVSPASTAETLVSVQSQWTQAIGFNSAVQSYEVSIIKGGTGSHSDTTPMYPMKGYWLFMNSPGTLAAISS